MSPKESNPLKSYSVIIEATITKVITVEALNEDEAKELAYQEFSPEPNNPGKYTEECLGISEVTRVSAEVHTDCRTFEAEFNATPWFGEASDDDIIELSQSGWGGDAEADDVALGLENKPGYEPLTDFFRGLRALRRKNSDIGFECYIKEEEALAWVKENRPHLSL